MIRNLNETFGSHYILRWDPFYTFRTQFWIGLLQKYFKYTICCAFILTLENVVSHDMSTFGVIDIDLTPITPILGWEATNSSYKNQIYHNQYPSLRSSLRILFLLGGFVLYVYSMLCCSAFCCVIKFEVILLERLILLVITLIMKPTIMTL